MAIELFQRAQLRATPWKNGGGVTREIVCYPPRASLLDFDWRISIAQISSDGDFSVFNGVDRVITLLEGAGIHLNSDDGSINHRLDTSGLPFEFSGDRPMHAQLLERDCHDLNVMTRRLVCGAATSVLRASDLTKPAAAGLLLALQGSWQVHTKSANTTTAHNFCLSAQTGLWWSDDMLAWACERTECEPRSDAALLVALIYPITGQN